MGEGKKDIATPDRPLDGLEEATAGWDPYVSDLLQEQKSAPREERRRQPRDRTPARRRTILVSRDESKDQD